MKSKEFFAGANTPYGFYSYFDNIINIESASRVYCIKGGPGTGKSTIMKNVGKYFEEKGEAVEYYRCSSDPNSLDAVVIKNKRIGLLDGTFPHIVDPVYPGAIDEIINLGEFWNEDGIKKNKDNIIFCNKKIKKAFNDCYKYLFYAQERWLSINQTITTQLETCLLYDLYSIINNCLSKIDKKDVSIENRKLFMTSITPLGVKTLINNNIEGLDNIIVLDMPIGFSCEAILSRSIEFLNEVGCSCDVFYCSMLPEQKIEHIISYSAGIGIFTSNDYHKIDASSFSNIRHIDINDLIKSKCDGTLYKSILAYYKSDINMAIEMLSEAKKLHDQLEKYYIDYMDYEKNEELTKKIIEMIVK